MSNPDIKSRIESTLSKILSRKYDANITIKFVDAKEKSINGNSNTSRDIRKK